LFPVTLNSSWTYDDGTTVTVTSVTDVEGRRYATITNNDGSGHLELVLSSSEVTFGSSSPNPDHIIAANYFAQNPLLKVPLNLNVTWNGDLLSNGYLVNFDCEVVSNTETVTIGGTVYSNCTEVTVDFSYPEGYDWPEWIVNRKLYFHSGVGCIRRVDTWTDSSITTMEVVAYDMR